MFQLFGQTSETRNADSKCLAPEAKNAPEAMQHELFVECCT